MKKILFALTVSLASLCCVSCDKDNFNNTGTANGVHKCSLYEYLKRDRANFDSLRIMVEHAGLTDLFDGKDADYPEITIFAIKNHSIIQYLKKTTGADGQPLYNRVTDIPATECREILLSYLITGKHYREEFPFEVKGELKGGKLFITPTNQELRVFRTQGSWNGVSDIGAEGIGIHFMESDAMTYVVTGDLTTNNAVIHALSTTFLMINPVVK